MAAELEAPFEPPTVDSEPSSPASSISTTGLAPRPIQLSPSGIWKPKPTLKATTSSPNFSLPMALPTPPASAALSPQKSTAATSTPSSTPTSASNPPTILSEKSATATVTASNPRSILKAGEVHPAFRPPGSSPTTSSSRSSSSLNCISKPKAKAPLKPAQYANNNTKRRSRGRSIKEGAFFAFVLLPLSCWYTRGGKRLGTPASGPPPSRNVEYGNEHGGKRNMIEWDDYFDDDDEELLVAEYERRGRAATVGAGAPLPELRRPIYGLGRKDSFGQVAAGNGVGVGAMKGRVIGRRGSFSAPVPKGVVVGRGNGSGHGRSNSFSSAGMRGRERDMMMRREFADYGVDRGAGAVDGDEWDLEREREMEFERLRLSRAKSRTGSPVPLRRRRSEV